MTRELWIDGTRIADDTPGYVIAEVGHNHGSDMGKAHAMIESAKEAGASAVKFQTRVPHEVYSGGSERGAYYFKSDNPQWMAGTYGDHRQLLEPSYDQWEGLFQKARDVGITAFSTPFDMKSANLLYSLGVPAFKIASGDATNIPLIEHCAQFGKPLIISTGGCTVHEVFKVYYSVFNTDLGGDFALLQCTCVYPCPSEAMNLNVISRYREEFPEIVAGLSTHNPDWVPTIAAYALGGRIFEHHYTNDQSWKGTDNHFSLTPTTMRALVDGLKATWKALGSSEKVQQEIEREPTLERRKRLVAARDLTKGTILGSADIAIKCPAWDGLPPYELGNVIGQTLQEDVRADQSLEWSMVKEEVRV